LADEVSIAGTFGVFGTSLRLIIMTTQQDDEEQKNHPEDSHNEDYGPIELSFSLGWLLSCWTWRSGFNTTRKNFDFFPEILLPTSNLKLKDDQPLAGRVPLPAKGNFKWGGVLVLLWSPRHVLETVKGVGTLYSARFVIEQHNFGEVDVAFGRLNQVDPINDDGSGVIVDRRDFVKILGHSEGLGHARLRDSGTVASGGIVVGSLHLEDHEEQRERHRSG